MNGDGIEDLAVSAPASDAGAADGGRVDVYAGGTGAHLFRFIGDRAGGALGYAVAPAGDADGDGFADLLVGEPGSAEDMAGRALVFRGAATDGSGGPIVRAASDAHLALTDNRPGAGFGLALAGERDIDGDGLPDLVVGAPLSDLGAGETKAGEATVFSGATGQAVGRVQGAAGSLTGMAVLLLPDVDADGLAELVVGAPGVPEADDPDQPTTIVSAGAVRVHGGADVAAAAGGEIAGIPVTLDAPADPGVMFGASLELGHDADGDGAADLLVGSSQPLAVADNPFPDVELLLNLDPKTHVYSGATAVLLYSFDTGDGSGNVIEVEYPGPAPGVAPDPFDLIGDVDGDGVVGENDLAMVLDKFGVTLTTPEPEDVNGDGVVNNLDVVLVLEHYGTMALALALEDCQNRVASGEFESLCECLILNVVTPDLAEVGLDCEGGGDDDDGGGPPPDDGDGDCGDMPRTTDGACAAWARCVAYGEEVGEDYEAARSARDAAEDAFNQADAAHAAAAEAANDAFVASLQLADSARTATNLCTDRKMVDHEARVAAAHGIDIGRNGMVTIGALVVAGSGGTAAPAVAIAIVIGGGIVTVYDLVENEVDAAPIADQIRATHDAARTEITRAFNGDPAQQPACVPPETWDNLEEAGEELASRRQTEEALRAQRTEAAVAYGQAQDVFQMAKEAYDTRVSDLTAECVEQLPE